MPVEMCTYDNDRGMQTMILELIEGLCLSKIFLNTRYTKVFINQKNTMYCYVKLFPE